MENFNDDSENLTVSNNISLPDFKKVSVQKLYNYVEQITDYGTLQELSNSINAARMALFKVTEQINHYERLEKESKLQYERAHRRTFMSSTEKTEAMKRARADLMNEELENQYIVNEQIKNELVRLSYSLRLELQTLQGVSNNLRQQMKME